VTTAPAPADASEARATIRNRAKRDRAMRDWVKCTGLAPAGVEKQFDSDCRDCHASGAPIAAARMHAAPTLQPTLTATILSSRARREARSARRQHISIPAIRTMIPGKRSAVICGRGIAAARHRPGLAAAVATPAQLGKSRKTSRIGPGSRSWPRFPVYTLRPAWLRSCETGRVDRPGVRGIESFSNQRLTDSKNCL